MWTQLQETHSLRARQGEGAGNRHFTGARKNVPVWQGPLGHSPSRYPGRNPVCLGRRLPFPQHRAAQHEATASPSPGMGLAALIGQCQAGTAPPLSSPPPRGTDTGGRPKEKGCILPQASGLLHFRLRSRTHQLEDVLILGHDGELQGVITTETGQGSGPAEAAGPGRTRALVSRAPRAKGTGCAETKGVGRSCSGERSRSAHLFWIRAMTWE